MTVALLTLAPLALPQQRGSDEPSWIQIVFQLAIFAFVIGAPVLRALFEGKKRRRPAQRSSTRTGEPSAGPARAAPQVPRPADVEQAPDPWAELFVEEEEAPEVEERAPEPAPKPVAPAPLAGELSPRFEAELPSLVPSALGERLGSLEAEVGQAATARPRWRAPRGAPSWRAAWINAEVLGPPVAARRGPWLGSPPGLC